MRKRLTIACFVFICMCRFSFAQSAAKRDKFWSAGFNVGMIGWSPSTNDISSKYVFYRVPNFGVGVLEDNHGNKHPSITANTSIGIHAGFMWKDKHRNSYTTIQAEFQRNKACYSFKLPFVYGFKGDTVTQWVEADSYLTYNLSVSRTWHFLKNQGESESFWYGKVAFGQTFMHRNLGETMPLNTQQDWTQSGQGFILKVTAASQQSWMLSPEIGRRFMLRNNNMVDIGLVYHAPFSDTRSIEYDFIRDGMPAGKNTINYHGSTVMLNLAYTINYKIKAKPVDSTRLNEQYEELAVDSTEARHDNNISHHHKVNGRHFEIQESMTVTNGEVTVLVWDKNRVDGDEISLYLNGKPVLENFTVSKVKKEIILKLEPGSNIIVMHALNLGRVPPNTAALNISDGTKKKNVTLVSDLHKSGALEIIYNP